MPLIRKPGKDAAGTPEQKPADVLNALTHGNADARWAAARAAMQLPGGADALCAALPNETDPRVREALLTSLARIGTPQCVAAIIPLLRVDDARARAGALDTLRGMPDAVRGHLPALLGDEDSDVRVLSCEIARSLPGEEATRVLDELLARETEVNVCAAAVEVLAEVGGPAALATLEQLAARFPHEAFLAFSIGVARERIVAQSGMHD